MVVIEKEDQDKVTAAIQRMERELFMLRSLLGDVARRSDNEGFLEAGDLIEIVGTNKEGNVEPKRAVVTEVKYRITSLRVRLEEDSGDGTESETELNLRETSVSKVSGAESEEEQTDKTNHYPEEYNSE